MNRKPRSMAMWPPTLGARRVLTHLVTLLILAASAAWSSWTPQAGAAPARQGNEIQASGLRQIEALLAEKDSRTSAQQKIDSNILYAVSQRRGDTGIAAVDSIDTGITTTADGKIDVDIIAFVNDQLLAKLQGVGADITYTNAQLRSISARVPLSEVEAIAGDAAVIFVQPKREGFTRSQLRSAAPSATAAADPVRAAASPALRSSLRPGFADRAANVRTQVQAALQRQAQQDDVRPDAVNVSQGDTTHRANQARTQLGVTGAGIKVGVLSDGVDSLASAISSGDLPANVTVLPGQAGSGNEGVAMLEIVYDLAPGAQLYFATGTNSIEGFANNIRALRDAGATIIVDDIGYFVESPFQKGQSPTVVSTTNGGVVSQAVNDVAATGVLYFSALGNDGNFNDGTSSVYEGNFADGGSAPAPIVGNLHDFDPGPGVTTFNTITAQFPAGFRNPLLLKWSDPLGGSANDYDLFILNAAGTTVLAQSTNVQAGTQDPFEAISGDAALAPGNRAVIVKKPTAAPRYLHLNFLGAIPQFKTPGQGYGHPTVPDALAIGATPAGPAKFNAADPAGPFPNPFNGSNKVETFSSDGPRQFFYNPDSSPITPGNFLAGGGQTVQKPDYTAADGVSTSAPGYFDPFFGTSAAAPHAAAIAALVKQVNPAFTQAQVRNFLSSTAIDIETPGVDRDSGVGIIDAFAAVQAAQSPTDVTLTNFTALGTAEGIEVQWQTSREENTWGFHVYRSADGTRANAIRITTTRIPAQGGSQGAGYSFLDTAAQPGTTYAYWIEETELDGATNDYGPVTGTRPTLINMRVFLPFVSDQ